MWVSSLVLEPTGVWAGLEVFFLLLTKGSYFFHFHLPGWPDLQSTGEHLFRCTEKGLLWLPSVLHWPQCRRLLCQRKPCRGYNERRRHNSGCRSFLSTYSGLQNVQEHLLEEYNVQFNESNSRYMVHIQYEITIWSHLCSFQPHQMKLTSTLLRSFLTPQPSTWWSRTRRWPWRPNSGSLGERWVSSLDSQSLVWSRSSTSPSGSLPRSGEPGDIANGVK